MVRGAQPEHPAGVPVGRHVPEPRHVRRHEPRGDRPARARAGPCRRSGRILGPGFGGAAGRRHVRGRPVGRGCRVDDRGPRAGRRDGGVRPVPPTRPPRGAGDVRRLLLLQQRRDRRARDHASHRGAGRDHRRGLPPRQRHAADLLASRRRPVRLDPRRSGPPVPVFPGPSRRDGGGRWRRREPEHPAPGRRDERRLPRGHGPGHRGDRGSARVRSSWSRSASTRTASTRSAISR